MVYWYIGACDMFVDQIVGSILINITNFFLSFFNFFDKFEATYIVNETKNNYIIQTPNLNSAARDSHQNISIDMSLLQSHSFFETSSRDIWMLLIRKILLYNSIHIF